MSVITQPSVGPRQELSLAVVEGAGAIDGLIGRKILPPMGITRRNAHLVKVTLADAQRLRIISAAKYIHAPGTKFERMVAKIGESTMTVDLRGVEIVVPLEAGLDYQGILDIENMFAGQFGRETAGLTDEALIAAAVFNTSNTSLGSATNSTVAYTAANFATNSFIADVIASIRRLRALGEQPDTVAMSGPVLDRARLGTLTQNFVKGQLYAGAETNAKTIQQALSDWGIKQVLVGETYYNAAADGATPSLSQIWSNTYVAVCKAGKVGGSETDGVTVPQLGGLGADVFWEGYTGDGKVSDGTDALQFEGGYFVESYPAKELDSTVLRLKMSNRPYVGNTRCLDLIATQYS